MEQNHNPVEMTTKVPVSNEGCSIQSLWIQANKPNELNSLTSAEHLVSVCFAL